MEFYKLTTRSTHISKKDVITKVQYVSSRKEYRPPIDLNTYNGVDLPERRKISRLHFKFRVLLNFFNPQIDRIIRL